PMSLNRWMYVQGNPVNYTDPSGKSPSDGDGYVPPNHRDLTSWLYREMYANANSAEARSIRETIDLSQKINDLSKGKGIGIWAGGIALSKLVWSIAATDWISLVKDGARWDFKDQIYDKMKKTIMLCHQVECEWFEYSVPGNIHYGYVGRASGFSSGILHGGASYAEITDPSHRELIKMYGRWFVNLHIDFSDCDINIPNIDIYANFDWWKTGFDDTTDFASVELGSQIFDISGYSPSMSTYQNMLWLFSPQLDHMPKPSEFYSNPDWPYPLRYFDGGG
ncbi:MAG: polymorphic toxin type 44 domain-containing protein, partial [Anaerolineae bacterium]|nr:polymorphic toxin type 44 domain-containing protein [Anaerolineae bacterium]